MTRFSLASRLRYRFDNLMARGIGTMIAGLALLSALLIASVAALVWASGIAPRGDDGQPLGLGELMWMSLLRTLDPGTMGSDKGSWMFLLAMLLVTMGGIFIVSALIGVLTSGIEQRLDELRKGRSIVVEWGHTVILGWSPQIFPVVSELALAQSGRRGCVAVLADKDKIEMEDELRARVDVNGQVRVVCRTGNPLDPDDLAVVNPYDSHAIIVLSPEQNDADLRVIKTLLALTHERGTRTAPYHIVAQIRDPRNMEAAKMVGKDEVELVLAGDFIARIAVQTCRQAGLSVVYTELLDFAGDEIYFLEEPQLWGKRFGEALLLSEASCLIGVRRKSGQIELAPSPHSMITEGDRIIAISQDETTLHIDPRERPSAELALAAVRSERSVAPKPERMLILGWNPWAVTIINELDHYVPPGSEVQVVASTAEAEAAIAQECGGLTRQTVRFLRGDTADRRVLDRLLVTPYEHVMVLSDAEGQAAQETDAQTLLTLLHLRDIANKSEHRFTIVSQMLDIRNRNLADVARVDDFIVSDTLVSLLLSQISQNKELAIVFRQLFHAQGPMLSLRPAVEYVAPYRTVSFATIVESARRRGEVAIGYRLKAHADNPGKNYGVRVNPRKSEEVAFGSDDRVIVLGHGR